MLRFGSVHQDSPTSVKGDRIPGHSTTPPKSSQTLVPEVREMPQVSKCNPYRTRVILLRPISCLAEVLGPCSGFWVREVSGRQSPRDTRACCFDSC